MCFTKENEGLSEKLAQRAGIWVFTQLHVEAM
jgi:hypothetical protein